MKKFLWIVLVFITVLNIIPSESFGQCAMCKAVAESSSGQIGAKNLNFGILFLMSIPYLLVSIIGFTMWRYYKASKKTM